MYGKGLVIGEKGSNPLEKQSANLKCWVTSSESGVSLLRTVIEGRTMWAGKAKNAVPHFSAYCIFCSSVYCKRNSAKTDATKTGEAYPHFPRLSSLLFKD